MGKTALVVGATGLIGNELLHILLNADEYDQVIAVVRTPLNLNHEKLVETIVDFDQLEKYKEGFLAEDIFCCLGTTIKKAGTKEAMYKVDVEYPLMIAKLALEQGAKQFLLVSAMNADPNAALFYPKMKGELEQGLVKIPFESIAIMRPSLLLGDRKEFKLGERVGGAIFKTLSFLFRGPLGKYRAIYGSTVASAMYKIAQMNKPGIQVYASEELESISNMEAKFIQS